MSPVGIVDQYDHALVTEAVAAADAPAVVAVCVTTDPGDGFDACLESLVAQDYTNLSLLIIDAGSADPIADRVAAVAPDAFIHRLQTNPGFAAAANQALTLVSDAPFLMFCHDDVALDAHGVSALLEELFRSNAGIVTPKIVEWDDPRRLRQVGMGSDRFGVQVDLVEAGEFDQEQYDGVRDVFVAPSGVQMVRSDLFHTLAGFDRALADVNEDLDFCWRAHAVGARVVVVPSTRVRHRLHEALAPQVRARLQARNRLRTLLVTSSRLTLLRTLPAAILLLLIESVYLFLSGRRSQASAVLGAIPWNLSRVGEIRERRAALREVRQVSDAEVRALQVGGSARLRSYFQGQFGAGQDRLVGLVGSVKSNLTGADAASAQAALGVATLLALLGIFGSRHLITRGITPVGQIPLLPGLGTLISEWWNGWRSVGIGAPSSAPVAFLILGLARILFLWGDGLFELMLVIGPLAIGAIGAWRLAGRFGSHRAAALAAFAYAANPIPVAAMSAGRWHGLVVWGATPFLIHSALRLQRAAPFDGPDRTLPIRLLRYGFLVAAAATFAPSVVLVAVVICAVLAVASIVIARPSGVSALVLGAVVAVVAPIGLHMPWSADVIRRFSWEWFVGPQSPESSFDSLADLMRFAPGGAGPGYLVIGLLVAASVGLLVAKGQRFDGVARGWALALAAWALVWTSRRGWLPADTPAAEIILPVAAAGLSLAVGCTVRALEIDLGARARLRRGALIGVTSVGLVALSLLGVRSAFDGRWDLPTQSYVSFTTLLTAQTEGPSRVLWLGAPSVLPLDTEVSPGGVHYAITDGGEPTILGSYAPGSYGVNDEIGERLDLVVDTQTARLGSLLAPYGIDVVVLVPRLAPAPYTGPTHDPGGGIGEVLDQQLDLQRVAGTPNLFVYRNFASRGPAVELESAEPFVAVSPREQLDADLTTGLRADLVLDGPGAWSGAMDSTGEILLSVPADGWEAANAATALQATSANTLAIERVAEGPLAVSYRSSSLARIVLVAQLALIVIGAILAQSRREGSQ